MKSNMFLKNEVGLLVVDESDKIIECSRYVRSMIKKQVTNLNILEILDSNSYVEYQANIVDLKKGQWKYCRLNFIDDEDEIIINECIIRKSVSTDETYSLILFPVSNILHRPDIEAEQDIMSYSQNIFHDLRSYLFTLNGEFEKLKKSTGDTEREETLEIIKSNLQGLNLLIENLGTYAQIEDGKFSFEKCDLLELISKVGKTVLSTIGEFKITNLDFSVVLNEEQIFHSTNIDEFGIMSFRKKFIIYCDENFFSRALLNLLNNAIKYSRNKNPPQITIKIYKMNGYDHIHIIDNGIGIRKAEKREIFKRGFRGNRDLVKKSRGSGIGLDISQKIMAKHKGTVELYDAKKDEYSDFLIKLPSKR